MLKKNNCSINDKYAVSIITNMNKYEYIEKFFDSAMLCSAVCEL